VIRYAGQSAELGEAFLDGRADAGCRAI